MSIKIASLYADISGDTTKLDKSLKSTKGELGTFKSSLGSAVSGLTGFNLAGLGVAAVVGGVATALKKSVTDVIAYNKSISDSAGATGMGVEELSRFVQVADDFGISMDSVTRSLQLATKNGFAPTIENIAALADKANAMNDPTERAAMLAKILGRNWAELDPVLRSGGAAIKANAAAQVDGLVVTQAEINKSEELRLRLDELGDSWTSLKNTVGLASAEYVLLNARATEDTNAWARMRLEIDGQKPTLIAYWKQWHLIEEALRGAENVEETGIVKLGFMKEGLEEVTAPAWMISIEDQKLTEAESGVKRLIAYLQEVTNRKWGINVGGSYMGPDQASSFGGPAPGTGGKRVEGSIVTGSLGKKYRVVNGKYVPMARGGPLTGVNEVGEQGTEGIINGQVIPHDEWMHMKFGLGLQPRHFGTGTGPGPETQLDIDWETFQNAPPGSYMGGAEPASGGHKKKAATTGVGAASAAGVATVQAVAAVATGTIAMATETQRQAAEVARAQLQETVRSNNNLTIEVKEMRKEIAKLNRTLPISIRDSIERIL